MRNQNRLFVHPPRRHSPSWHLPVLLSLCLLLRLGLFVASTPWDRVVEETIVLRWEPDSMGYHELATNLIESGRFSHSATDGPDALRTPGYPLFVAGVYLLFGMAPWVVLLFQVFLEMVGCALLYATLTRFLNSNEAFAGTLFYAFDPHLAFSAVVYMSDSLFVFLLVVGFFFFAKGLQSRFGAGTGRDVALSALFFGLATLVRPVGEYFGVVLTLFILVVLRREGSRAFGRGLLFLGVFVLTLSPWIVRNSVHFGSLSLSTSGPYNLLVLDVVPCEVEQRHEPYKSVEAALLREADSLMAKDGLDPITSNGFVRAKYQQQLAVQYMRDHPLLFAKHFGLGILHSFVNLGTDGFAKVMRLETTKEFGLKGSPNLYKEIERWFREKPRSQIVLGLVLACYLGVSYILLGVGCFVSWKRVDNVFMALCAVGAVYFVGISGSAGLVRFKLPAIPFLLAFTGVGAWWVLERVRRIVNRYRGR